MVLNGEDYINGAASGTHGFQSFNFSSDYVATYTVATLPSGYTFSHWSYNSGGTDSKITVSISGRVLTITAKPGYKLAGSSLSGEEIVTGTFTGKLYLNYSGPIQEKYRVTVVAGEGGSVTGGGEFYSGGTCTVSAFADNGYVFYYWSDYGEQTHSFTVTRDITLTAYFKRTFAIVNVIASPSQYGTVSGGGIYNLGDTCTVTATERDTSDYFSEFLYWDRHPSKTFSFKVTEDVTLTAYFRPYRIAAVRLRRDDRYNNQDWMYFSSTISCGSQSSTTTKESDAAVKVYGNNTVTVSTRVSGNPSWVKNVFEGFYINDEKSEGGTLVSSDSWYQFTPSKRTTNLYAEYSFEIMFKLFNKKSLTYSESSELENIPYDSELTPTVESETEGFTIKSISYKSSYWEVWVKFSSASYNVMKITSPVKKISGNEYTYGPLYLTSDDFMEESVSYRETIGGLGTWSGGQYSFGNTYRSTDVFIRRIGKFRLTLKGGSEATSSEPKSIYCVYSGPPYMTVVLKGRNEDAVRKMAIGSNRKSASILLYADNDPNSHNIGMTSLCEYESDMVSYKLKIPVSGLNNLDEGFFMNFEMMAWITPSWSLYMKKIVGSLSTLLKSGNADTGISKSITEPPTQNQDFTILMYLGTYLPLISNSSGIILTGSNGKIMNDS